MRKAQDGDDDGDDASTEQDFSTSASPRGGCSGTQVNFSNQEHCPIIRRLSIYIYNDS